MKIILWNCRGLGHPRTVHALLRMVQHHSPDILFLSETRLSSSSSERLRLKLQFNFCFPVLRSGLGGGLLVMWNASCPLTVSSFSSSHIDTVINLQDALSWRFTGIYGSPSTGSRPAFWSLLRRLAAASSLPWVCGGDFNEILSNSEIAGSNGRAEYLMQNFRDALQDCALCDIGYSGYSFTWSNNRSGTALVEERLDRVVSSDSWSQQFLGAYLRHLASPASDHSPLLLTISRGPTISNRSCRFHFEEFWCKIPECESIIKNSWMRMTTL
ncbi:uncharacterized protein LOC119994946 [Tripterygium wilfordii]|uniref:uncharacterized protein LOC119994946 n=1 Tax=Tripterygium wilfordii TaxID=458696 RepID=UPI0018F801A4|nr:uncharacterized protein LOC119994946 [Tripterygium wilfordii]